MHRTIMGFYLLLACLVQAERNIPANVFPLTLGPHGSSFDDVVDALELMQRLDRGVDMDINGKTCFVCIPFLAFIGDMPQQQLNGGFLGPTANFNCRFCTIDAPRRGNLDFNVVHSGRYHFEVMRQRQHMDSVWQKTHYEAFARANGMRVEFPALKKLAPCNPINIDCPGDMAHSEAGGITELLHLAILDQVLTPQAAIGYTQKVRSFPFPPGWIRIQSPLFYIGSYTLQEHARWSVIIPVLFRLRLRASHIKPTFLQEAHIVFSTEVLELAAVENPKLPTNDHIVTILVKAVASVAKVNTLLSAAYLTTAERASLHMEITASRSMFQRLCEVASRAAAIQTRAFSRVGSRTGSVEPGSSTQPTQTPMSTITASITLVAITKKEAASTKNKAAGYRNNISRPNVHAALHYPLVQDQYALVSNVHALGGELKHRSYKKNILRTNKKHPEKDLLEIESFTMTLRFLLHGSFQVTHPALSAQFQNLRVRCPQLFTSLMPHATIAQLQVVPGATGAGELDADHDISLATREDDTHRQPSVLGRIPNKYVEQTLQLPVSVSKFSAGFRAKFFRSYSADYKMPVNHPGTRRLRWWKKVSFVFCL
ncbi:hypothetical protein P152DRAFT_462083 [Eremomyces bilateralis CBS 781.70]|uniref:Uncharacterized protein n=1 Tax=Eremomyces bilateralis CBS 781.70 TaxID=1392243 RepID=A0A6G1FSX0_9PEZI|nr:uncharacterized protein P152DRAFT_462083 [Eremomyces bilateralis CBS 781.70]KAF1808853.1 hypothetical protein P152DRAFT_462083 [Eremomyces bilateralis CBS 781.70]